jgi:hypothetical protein
MYSGDSRGADTRCIDSREWETTGVGERESLLMGVVAQKAEMQRHRSTATKRPETSSEDNGRRNRTKSIGVKSAPNL